MLNLSFEDNKKELTINGDDNKVIRFNPCDYNFVNKIGEIHFKIDEAFAKIDEEEEDEYLKLKSKDAAVRKEIDNLFGYDVSDIIFEKTNCISLAGGTPIFMNFLSSLINYVDKCIKEEEKKSSLAIKKYTDRVKK